MQLPPVDMPSLAVPLDETGRLQVEEEEEPLDKNKAEEDKHAEAEHRGGYELWQLRETCMGKPLPQTLSLPMQITSHGIQAGARCRRLFRAIEAACWFVGGSSPRRTFCLQLGFDYPYSDLFG